MPNPDPRRWPRQGPGALTSCAVVSGQARGARFVSWELLRCGWCSGLTCLAWGIVSSDDF